MVSGVSQAVPQLAAGGVEALVDTSEFDKLFVNVASFILPAWGVIVGTLFIFGTIAKVAFPEKYDAAVYKGKAAEMVQDEIIDLDNLSEEDLAAVAALEAERTVHVERLQASEAQLRRGADETSSRDAAYRELDERCRRQEAQLHEQRSAAAELFEERSRSVLLVQQRDAAEVGRVKAQESLAELAEKVRAAEERRRAAESELRDARTKLKAEAVWEARCKDAEQERARLQERLNAAIAETRAVVEREQVLLPASYFLLPTTHYLLLDPMTSFGLTPFEHATGARPACGIA